MIVISSENRAGYGKKNLDVFKESGDIEYSADIAGILASSREEGRKREVTLHIVKQRNGERASIKYTFIPALSVFIEGTKESYQEEDSH